jgi:hypothetical protein
VLRQVLDGVQRYGLALQRRGVGCAVAQNDLLVTKLGIGPGWSSVARPGLVCRFVDVVLKIV